MAETTAPHPLLAADVGDGLMVQGRRLPITNVGLSRAVSDDFRTREFTLGDDDFYLVLEGDILGGGPGRARAILTHELAEREVTCEVPGGKRRPVTLVIGEGTQAPAEVLYQSRRYRLSRRTDATYTSPARSCGRTTWDYEANGRNLAVERWPEGEMAVYEGRVVPLDAIEVLPKFGETRAGKAMIAGRSAWSGRRIASPVGVAIGLVMIAVGFLLLAI